MTAQFAFLQLLLVCVGGLLLTLSLDPLSPNPSFPSEISGTMSGKLDHTIRMTIKPQLGESLFEFQQHKSKFDLIKAKILNEQARVETTASHNTDRKITVEPIKDSEWESYSNRGLVLNQLLNANITTATEMLREVVPSLPSSESPWIEDRNLENYGWVTEDLTAEIEDGDGNVLFDRYVEREMHGLAPYPCQTQPQGKAPIVVVESSQKRNVEVDGTDYLASDGHYTNIYNVEQGSIMAWSGYTPANGVKTKGNGSPTVPLQTWEDVTFLEWQRRAEEDVHKLRYLWALHILDPITQSIIKTALQNRGAKLVAWPGYMFHWGSPEGRALLASPVGRDIAWMMIRHKAQLGRKVYLHVSVFTDERFTDNQLPSLRFWFNED